MLRSSQSAEWGGGGVLEIKKDQKGFWRFPMQRYKIKMTKSSVYCTVYENSDSDLWPVNVFGTKDWVSFLSRLCTEGWGGWGGGGRLF